VDPAVAGILMQHNKDFIEDFLALSDEELAEIGLSAEQQSSLKVLIEEHIEIVEEEYEEEQSPESEDRVQESAVEESVVTGEEYECPECGASINVEMTSCPNCGIGLSFEYEDDSTESSDDTTV
jgi:N utilization substance protein A